MIASQSIITGAFSMTRQTIRLGWLPRLKIKQTSAEGYGQIYVGAVNWLLMLVTLGLTIGFGKSDNLASAYGIAVSATMLMTSFLLFIAMREIWNWPVAGAALVAGLFVVVDASFLAANLAKLFEGGYVPLILASLVYGLMWVWHRGVEAVHATIAAAQVPLDDFAKSLQGGGLARVPGTAVFLTRARTETPPVLSWHVKQNRSLHRKVLALTITTEQAPRVPAAARVSVRTEADNFWRAEAKFGFIEKPDVGLVLAECRRLGADIDLDDLTFYVGHETIVPREDGKGLPRVLVMLFAALGRNATRLSDMLELPHDRVVEIGREIAI